MADYDPQRGRARPEGNGEAAPVDGILGGEAPDDTELPSVQSAMEAASKKAAAPTESDVGPSPDEDILPVVELVELDAVVEPVVEILEVTENVFEVEVVQTARRPPWALVAAAIAVVLLVLVARRRRH